MLDIISSGPSNTVNVDFQLQDTNKEHFKNEVLLQA